MIDRHGSTRWRWLLRSVAFIVAMSCPRAVRADEAWPDILRRVSPSVVQVRLGKVWGTGFLYPTPRYVVTSYWVVNQRGSPVVALGDGSGRDARVVAWSKEDDLALLELETPAKASALTLETTPLFSSEVVSLVGYPTKADPTEEWYRRLDVPIPRFGRVSVIYPTRVELDADATHGDSGAPVISPSGAVVGVASMHFSVVGTVTTIRAERVKALAEKRGKQAEFDPSPAVDASLFNGISVSPISSDGFIGAGWDEGYRYGWFAAEYDVSFFKSSLEPRSNGNLQSLTRYSLELFAEGQVPPRGNQMRIWFGPGVRFSLEPSSVFHLDSSGGYRRSNDVRGVIHPLVQLGNSGGLLFYRLVLDVADPSLRFDVGLLLGR